MPKLFRTTVSVREAARITRSSLAGIYAKLYKGTIPARRNANGKWEIDVNAARAYGKLVAAQRRFAANRAQGPGPGQNSRGLCSPGP